MNSPQSPTRKTGQAETLPAGDIAFLVVGKLHRPHGVKGEIILEVLTDFPERLQVGTCLYIGPDRLPLRLASRRWHGQSMLVSFEGFTTPEQVGALRNQYACVTAADRPALPEGEYYHHQILGLQAVTEGGRLLGVVSEILETGANDVLVIRPEIGAEVLVPLIDEVVKAINLETGQLLLTLLPGLLADE